MNVELFEELLYDNADYAELADALVDCEWDSTMAQKYVESEIETVLYQGDSWTMVYYYEAWNFLKNVDPSLSWSLSILNQRGSADGANVCTLANDLLAEILNTQYGSFIRECVDEGVFADDDDLEL